jgi:hypothetical protein
MHLILRYPNGRRVDALLLTIGPESMRAAVHERNETLEFLRVGEWWLGEKGERIAIEAMISAQTTSAPRTLAAGRAD